MIKALSPLVLATALLLAGVDARAVPTTLTYAGVLTDAGVRECRGCASNVCGTCVQTQCPNTLLGFLVGP